MYGLCKSSHSTVWRTHPCSCRFKLRNEFPVLSSLLQQHVKLAIQKQGSWPSSAASPSTDASAHCPWYSSLGTSLWPLNHVQLFSNSEGASWALNASCVGAMQPPQQCEFLPLGNVTKCLQGPAACPTRPASLEGPWLNPLLGFS